MHNYFISAAAAPNNLKTELRPPQSLYLLKRLNDNTPILHMRITSQSLPILTLSHKGQLLSCEDSTFKTGSDRYMTLLAGTLVILCCLFPRLWGRWWQICSRFFSLMNRSQDMTWSLRKSFSSCHCFASHAYTISLFWNFLSPFYKARRDAYRKV